MQSSHKDQSRTYKFPSKLFETEEGRNFLLDLLLLQENPDPIPSDCLDVEILEARIALNNRKMELIEILRTQKWKDYLPKPKEAHVYFIFDPVHKAIKIGFSTNVENRLENLQHGNVKPLKLLGTTIGGRSLEQRIHKKFSHLKIRGEWFKDTKELRDFIANPENLRRT